MLGWGIEGLLLARKEGKKKGVKVSIKILFLSPNSCRSFPKAPRRRRLLPISLTVTLEETVKKELAESGCWLNFGDHFKIGPCKTFQDLLPSSIRRSNFPKTVRSPLKLAGWLLCYLNCGIWSINLPKRLKIGEDLVLFRSLSNLCPSPLQQNSFRALYTHLRVRTTH